MTIANKVKTRINRSKHYKFARANCGSVLVAN